MQLTPRSFQLRSFAQLGAVGLALVVTQTGCPGGADLEHPEAWAGRFGTGAETGSGGSGPVAGSGGSTTAGTGNTPPPFDINAVVCGGGLSAKTVMAKCSTVGCHAANLPQADLNLTTLDMGLATRTKDVVATYGDIPCNAVGQPYMACVPASCPTAAMAKLVDSTNWQASWIISKIKAAQNGCGDFMPPTGTTALTTDEEACVEAVVKAIAGQ